MSDPREVLSVAEHGEDAVLERDFYRDPTGQWIYKWADERYAIVESNGVVSQLRANLAAALAVVEAAIRVTTEDDQDEMDSAWRSLCSAIDDFEALP